MSSPSPALSLSPSLSPILSRGTHVQRNVWLRDPVTDSWPSCSLQCRRCRSSARHHPRTRQIIGCLVCGFSTLSVVRCFAPSRCAICRCHAAQHDRRSQDAGRGTHHCRSCGGIHDLTVY